jgi:hypothetical protein
MTIGEMHVQQQLCTLAAEEGQPQLSKPQKQHRGNQRNTKCGYSNSNTRKEATLW